MARDELAQVELLTRMVDVDPKNDNDRFLVTLHE
jgi:hypothetical protein